jgi:hypothetical protein
MACSICHDAQTIPGLRPVSQQLTVSTMRSSAQNCPICGVLLSTLMEHGMQDDHRIVIRNDDRDWDGRPSQGIHIHVSAERIIDTVVTLMVRNLHGEHSH